MSDPKNGKGGFNEFAKHEKAMDHSVPPLVSQPGASSSVPGSAAQHPDGAAAKPDSAATKPARA